MQNKKTFGLGDEAIVINTTRSDTTPAVSTIIPMGSLDSIGFSLVADTTLDGAWLIEASNNFVPSATAPVNGQGPTTAKWTDCTALFAKSATGTAIAAVAHGTAATQNQYAFAYMRARHLRVTFTPSAGSGNVLVIAFGASNS